MKDTSTKAAEKLHTAVASSAEKIPAQTEQAIDQAKANFEQVASHSRDAMTKGMKAVDAMTGAARGNVDTLLESSRIATGGLQAIARDVAEFSRKNLERTTSTAHALSLAKSAPELMQLQTEFARTQFNAVIGEVSKLSESMFKMMTDMFEPLQKQAMTAVKPQEPPKEG